MVPRNLKLLSRPIAPLARIDPRMGERRITKTQTTSKKSGRPRLGRPGLAKSSGEEGKTFYSDGGFALAVGVGLLLGAWAGFESAPVLVIRRISTRRFLARPSAVLLLSTGLSLPSPIR